MCGIFSFISNNNSFEIDVNYITNNLNKIKKRGPDNTQTKLINNVFPKIDFEFCAKEIYFLSSEK